MNNFNNIQHVSNIVNNTNDNSLQNYNKEVAANNLNSNNINSEQTSISYIGEQNPDKNSNTFNEENVKDKEKINIDKLDSFFNEDKFSEISDSDMGGVIGEYVDFNADNQLTPLNTSFNASGIGGSADINNNENDNKENKDEETKKELFGLILDVLSKFIFTLIESFVNSNSTASGVSSSSINGKFYNISPTNKETKKNENFIMTNIENIISKFNVKKNKIENSLTKLELSQNSKSLNVNDIKISGISSISNAPNAASGPENNTNNTLKDS